MLELVRSDARAGTTQDARMTLRIRNDAQPPHDLLADATTDPRDATIVLHVVNFAALSPHFLNGARDRVAMVSTSASASASCGSKANKPLESV